MCIASFTTITISNEIEYVECFYICKMCKASYSGGEGVGCVYLYQVKTYEEAVVMMEKNEMK